MRDLSEHAEFVLSMVFANTQWEEFSSIHLLCCRVQTLVHCTKPTTGGKGREKGREGGREGEELNMHV